MQITDSKQVSKIERGLEKRSFATLATSSEKGWPHVAGVLYELIDGSIYINTRRSSRKAKNVEASQRVALCVPMRRLPVGPPSTVHFQSKAELLGLDDPQVERLVASGRLKSITSHGELDLEDGCFLRITVPPKLLTYGLGMPIRRFVADPLGAGGYVETSLSA